MSIMPCYPDERAIENELGGKWEKVETITLNASDVLIYDVDTDNKTPLNINGYMFHFRGTASGNVTTYVYDNPVQTDANIVMYSPSMLSSSNTNGFIRNKCENGYNNLLRVIGTNKTSAFNTTVTLNGFIKPFVHDYLKLAVYVPENSEIEIDVYFLRGV